MKLNVVEPFGKFFIATVSSAIVLGYLLASPAQSAPLTIERLTGVPTITTTPVAADSDAAKGEQLFTANCAACHQATGEGVPGAFPALKGNAVVNDANPAAHIHAVLFGLEGATVDGVKYESAMPEFGTALSDADIADIINYERSSWGNHGKLVTAQDVSTERAKGK